MAYVKKTTNQMINDSWERSQLESFEVQMLDESHYIVYNWDHESEYIVEVDPYEHRILNCSCPHYIYRCEKLGIQCKHQVYVAQQLEYYA